MAADAYGRFRGIGVCFATSGPGVTNLITGTCCSHFDSVPMLALGGQVPSRLLHGNDRQMGFQEVNGVDLFKPVSKVSREYRVPQDLETCIQTAKQPRAGVAYLEIPDDLQRTQIADVQPSKHVPVAHNTYTVEHRSFKRPLLILGAGASLANINIEIPFLYTWRTKDRYYDHPLCKGGFGITSDSAGNALLNEADLLIMMGTRMDTHQVPDWSTFAPNAYKLSIGLEFPHPVDERIDCEISGDWTVSGPNWCKRVEEDHPDGPLYQFIDELSAKAAPEDIIIPDMGQTGCIVFQRWKIKQGQRLFNAVNHSPMGYAIPAAIGASLATDRRVIVIVGDGSLMMNIQELQTISDLGLPINIYVVNNGGYGMIRQTQDDWKEFLIPDVACNFKIPDVRKLADAFGLKYSADFSGDPSIYELKIKDTRITPKHVYGKPLKAL